jgi:hypothetical protein
MSDQVNDPDENRSAGIFAGLRAGFNRLLSGSAPSDPLYLSNRTFLQKFGVWLLIAIPCVAAMGVLVVLKNRPAPAGPAPKEITRREIALKEIPDLKDLKVSTNTDVELTSIHVDRAPSAIRGRLKNPSGRNLKNIEVVFDVTDSNGSRLGAVALKMSDLKAGDSRDFTLPLPEKSAVHALVREIHTR